MALILAACGGSDSASTSETVSVDDSADAAVSAAPDDAGNAEGANDTDTPVATGPGLVDLVGPDVVSSAEIETNLLPSVVLDDVSTGQKVNFRNLVPQEKPILLWMYAPH